MVARYRIELYELSKPDGIPDGYHGLHGFGDVSRWLYDHGQFAGYSDAVASGEYHSWRGLCLSWSFRYADRFIDAGSSFASLEYRSSYAIHHRLACNDHILLVPSDVGSWLREP